MSLKCVFLLACLIVVHQFLELNILNTPKSVGDESAFIFYQTTSSVHYESDRNRCKEHIRQILDHDSPFGSDSKSPFLNTDGAAGAMVSGSFFFCATVLSFGNQSRGPPAARTT